MRSVMNILFAMPKLQYGTNTFARESAQLAPGFSFSNIARIDNACYILNKMILLSNNDKSYLSLLKMREKEEQEQIDWYPRWP